MPNPVSYTHLFNAFGDPIDGGPEIEGQEVEIGGPSVNPVRRKQPSELIATGIAGRTYACARDVKKSVP